MFLVQATGCTNNELATIHEHEAMLFNSSVDSSSDSQEKPSDSSQVFISTDFNVSYKCINLTP